MKNITQQFKDYLAGENHTLTTCWKVTRTDGMIYTFTNLDINLVIDDLIYLSSNSYDSSNIKTTSQLSVDNMELTTFLKRKNLTITDFANASIITQEDISRGIWDLAEIVIFMVNYTDLSMGKLILRTGTIGEIKATRNTAIIELRSKKQKLNQQYGRTYVPQCDAKLGDNRCTVNIDNFTFDGTVSAVISQHAWIDDSLTQTNSTKTKNITNIQAGSTTYINCPNHGFSSGDGIKFGGISGSMSGLNGKSTNVNYINADNFSVPIDSSYMLTEVITTQGTTSTTTLYNYSYSNSKNPKYNGSQWNTNGGTYIGNGTVSNSVDSEYFQYGTLTWLTGNNKGMTVEVKNYSPQYIFIAERMIGKINAGDTYSIKAGCDGLASTCFKRFNNIAFFRGFNLIPGTDAFLSGS